MLYPFDEIRKHYEKINSWLVRHPGNWYDPYSEDIDWCSLFTRIEFDAWQVIRCYGKLPLYPQYPVDKYFIDFGNPALKIGIECDGKEYHTDKQKDQERDKRLHELHGWKIYRISGSDCARIIDNDDYDLEERDYESIRRRTKEFYKTTVEGLVYALGLYYLGVYYSVLDTTDIESIAQEVLDERISIKSIHHYVDSTEQPIPILNP